MDAERSQPTDANHTRDNARRDASIIERLMDLRTIALTLAAVLAKVDQKGSG